MYYISFGVNVLSTLGYLLLDQFNHLFQRPLLLLVSSLLLEFFTAGIQSPLPPSYPLFSNSVTLVFRSTAKFLSLYFVIVVIFNLFLINIFRRFLYNFFPLHKITHWWLLPHLLKFIAVCLTTLGHLFFDHWNHLFHRTMLCVVCSLPLEYVGFNNWLSHFVLDHRVPHFSLYHCTIILVFDYQIF